MVATGSNLLYTNQTDALRLDSKNHKLTSSAFSGQVYDYDREDILGSHFLRKRKCSTGPDL